MNMAGIFCAICTAASNFCLRTYNLESILRLRVDTTGTEKTPML